MLKNRSSEMRRENRMYVKLRGTWGACKFIAFPSPLPGRIFAYLKEGGSMNAMSKMLQLLIECNSDLWMRAVEGWKLLSNQFKFSVSSIIKKFIISSKIKMYRYANIRPSWVLYWQNYFCCCTLLSRQMLSHGQSLRKGSKKNRHLHQT